jgi:hypothetical protein
MGGEGISLKERKSIYRPGGSFAGVAEGQTEARARRHDTGGSAERIAWCDQGEAVQLEMN